VTGDRVVPGVATTQPAASQPTTLQSTTLQSTTSQSTALCIDPRALATLSADLTGDGASVHRFIRDFLGLWQARVDRLKSALACEALDALHVVLLSIRTSASMLGAVLLEASAALMLGAVQRADLAACSAQLSHLIQSGQEACRALVAGQAEWALRR
jgi:hypothetical protein